MDEIELNKFKDKTKISVLKNNTRIVNAKSINEINSVDGQDPVYIVSGNTLVANAEDGYVLCVDMRNYDVEVLKGNLTIDICVEVYDKETQEWLLKTTTRILFEIIKRLVFPQ